MSSLVPAGVKPVDAQFSEHSMFYKLGAHGFLFYWAGPEFGWLRSSRTEDDARHMQKLGEDY